MLRTHTQPPPPQQQQQHHQANEGVASLMDIHEANSCVTANSSTSSSSSSSSGLGGTASDNSSCGDYPPTIPPPPPLQLRIQSTTSTAVTMLPGTQCPPRVLRPSPYSTFYGSSTSPSSVSSLGSSQFASTPSTSMSYQTYQNINSLYGNYAVPSQLGAMSMYVHQQQSLPSSNYMPAAYFHSSPIHCITVDLEKDEKGELGIFINSRKTADGSIGYVVSALETGSPAHRYVTLC